MHIDPAIEGALRQLLRAFLAENAVINLSALRTEDACWHGNILDSLSFVDLLVKIKHETSHFKVLDVGAGGGFPLLPIAIALPQATCVGLDSIGKKMLAVQRIIDACGIPNASTLTGRTEDLGHDKKHRESYDVVTARAVAALPLLLEMTSPFVKIGGRIVLWKSLQIDEEFAASANAQKALHCELETRYAYTLPGDWGTRQLLVFRKTAALDTAYPRPVAIAKKHPL